MRKTNVTACCLVRTTKGACPDECMASLNGTSAGVPGAEADQASLVRNRPSPLPVILGEHGKQECGNRKLNQRLRRERVYFL